jgi:hypothetical protein
MPMVSQSNPQPVIVAVLLNPNDIGPCHLDYFGDFINPGTTELHVPEAHISSIATSLKDIERHDTKRPHILGQWLSLQAGCKIQSEQEEHELNQWHGFSSPAADRVEPTFSKPAAVQMGWVSSHKLEQCRVVSNNGSRFRR